MRVRGFANRRRISACPGLAALTDPFATECANRRTGVSTI
jgi:hypothetical protein